MDEDFFFPQNVRTEYRLLGMGPRHLRRAVVGAVALLLLGIGAGTAGVSVTLIALVGTLLGGCYAMGYCVPVYRDDLTLWDLWRKMKDHRERQTVFAKAHQPAQEVTAPDDLADFAKWERETRRH